jgi:hypothetical protein
MTIGRATIIIIIIRNIGTNAYYYITRAMFESTTTIED